MSNQPIDYQALAEALIRNSGGAGVRMKGVSSTPTASYGHGGKGGLFSAPGMAKPLFSAMILPRTGLASRLPVKTSNETNPLYGIITGVTGSTGSEPTGVCDDPPVTGLTKLCTHQFVFGRFSRASRVFDIDRIGKIINRSDFLDFNMYGNPFGDNQMANPLGTTAMSGAGDAAGIARNEIAKAMFEMAVAWSRDFAKKTYTASPTNNTAGGGHQEFYGMETLVNDGYRDALTGVACPAADAIVRDYNNVDVSTNPAGIIRQLSNIYRNLKRLASMAQLDPVDWSLTMPFGLFYELTDLWPCSYLSYRCNITSGSTNFINAGDAERMRDEMRGDLYNYQGQYLLIDGQRVPVIIDDAIPETQTGPSFISDIYFVPFSVLGGVPVTYWETFNYDGPNGPLEFARQFAPGDSYYVTDGGRFLWHKKPPTNFCVQVLAKTEPRLMLLTPYLSARLQNVKYTPIQHERSPFTDSAYFVNGGSTAQDTTVPSFFSPNS